MSDIRKWFMKAHDKGKGNASKPANPAPTNTDSVLGGQETSGRRKTSKYFPAGKQQPKGEQGTEELPAKRKVQNENESVEKPPPSKKPSKVDIDDDFVFPKSKNTVDVTPSKKRKSGSGRGVAQKAEDNDESDEDDAKDLESPVKSGGRGGRGGRGASVAPASGRGRGRGRGGFMNFGERKDPPHKGEKEVPEGASDCLAGLTFVISGTLDSLEREEAEDLIKRHGGRITAAVSKKTNYLLCDEDIEGRKSSKAKELGIPFLTEDGLFDMIRASNRGKAHSKEESKKSAESFAASLPKKSPQKMEVKSNSSSAKISGKSSTTSVSSTKQRGQPIQQSSLTWTEKYRPKVPNEITGNQSLVNQLHNWLAHWNEQFLGNGSKGKGKKQNDPGAKKAVLLSGTPGIGKTTSAKLVSQMLGFQTIEVNASDSRGKADAKISKGIGGSNANSIKELVSNEALSVNMDRSKHVKTVLIMDEVDGMSAGDRGGIADLIASIKISKIPIICICNDRYSQKLKSLVNYCLLLSFRKPTKQQLLRSMYLLSCGFHYPIFCTCYCLGFYLMQLFGIYGGKLRMDERIDLSMSDPDLVPLLIQENYINYRPSSIGKDDSGMKRMNLIARAAESIGDGDIINVQIRRYRQWQLSQAGSLSSCIIPAALLHGQRETLEQGERNFNRFGGWLGKNSTMSKNYRLLEDLHVHVLASRESSSGRETLRLDYLTVLLTQLTNPLRDKPKDKAVKQVVEFMNAYSISQEDFDTVVELSKFQGHSNPLEGIPPAVKAALTKAYNEGSRTQMVRAADLVTLPGMKKAPKKRIAAILEPSGDVLGEENGDTLPESEENSSDTEDLEGTTDGEKLQAELLSLNSKGIEVQMELKGTGNSSAKKAPAGRGGGGKRASGSAEKKGGRGSGARAKRKR
ncbi:replication factor C subunit 1 [Herrania umbratica]|uniref:Replication factor C subunit 1 n=1 Tax=Herrania umbratica TaxID=108875 RepID=A0A6J1BC29_9ROSI|nr:replication factor C subunit 1 [Herrania umbratica]